jgi:chitinase
VGASQAHMSNVQWNNIVPLIDMINLMSYDFFGAWDANANHNSPLYAPACGDPSFNIDSAFRALTTVYGVPANKINIGVAFYGRTQSGYTSLCGSTSGQSAVNAFPPDGVPLYYDIYNNIGSYTRNWDSNAEVPYLTGNGIFVSYDDEESIGKKADYINANGACGAIIWEITGDYIETAPGSGVIAGTPLADTLNAVFCQNPTLSTNDPLPQHSIEVFPVPASDQLNISGLTSTSGNVMIRILDLSGRTVMEESRTVNNGNSQLNISDLSTGTYFLQVIAEGNSIAKKFTIQK